MEEITEGVKNIAIATTESHKKNRIQVSNTKKPLFFYVNLAKRYMQQHNEVELSALGMAISTVVTIAEILKNNGLAVEKKIQTSTIDMKDESRGGRPIQKAKIEILLGKTDKFDELMAAAADERGEVVTEVVDEHRHPPSMSSFTQKRRSSSMTRTKSAKGFDFNKGFSEDTLQSQEKSEEPAMVRRSVWGGSEPSNMNFASQLTPFPRKPRRSSVEFADDLKICGFCRGEIGAGKDIFMYRGEVGFCSMECREERMTLDEIKEKEKLKSSRLASKAKNDVEHKLSSAKQNIISVSDVPTPVAGGKIIVPLSIA